MQQPFTLRSLYNLRAPDRLVAPRTALVLVDIQHEFLTGRVIVEGARAVALRAAALASWARRLGIAVVHVRHVAARADSPVFAPGSAACELAVPPVGREVVITKHQAGGFTNTELDGYLRGLAIDTLVVCGIMTHLAVDSTARDAAVLGYRVVVVGDACATRALPGACGGDPIAADVVHRVALAALADRFADVVCADDVTALEVTPA